MMDSEQSKPMEMSFSEATNQGIAHMAAGRLAQASSSFTKAVRTLKAMAEENVPIRNAIVLQRIPIYLPIEAKTKVSIDGSFEMFTSAFSVSFDEDEGMFDYCLAIGTVLYNMALNEHIAAICYEKAIPHARAIHIYKMAEQMLCQVSVASASASEALLLLARSNNQGHCQASIFDSSGSNHCRDQLIAIFGITHEVLSEEDRIFFQLACLVGDSIKTGRLSPAA